MKRFIGTKIVNATPMTRLAYNTLRGWTVPADENPADEGYLVEYQDGGRANVEGYAGYVSWSPKDVFEASYRETTGLSFGLALDAMKAGLKVSRRGWNGGGQWVCYGAGGTVAAEGFWNPHTRAYAERMGGYATVRPYFILKTAQNDIMMGWSPSQSDALAEDWLIVE